MDTAMGHFGNWGRVVLWTVRFGLFVLFTPLYKKS
jgi:hypothetical protein